MHIGMLQLTIANMGCLGHNRVINVAGVRSSNEAGVKALFIKRSQIWII